METKWRETGASEDVHVNEIYRLCRWRKGSGGESQVKRRGKDEDRYGLVLEQQKSQH